MWLFPDQTGILGSHMLRDKNHPLFRTPHAQSGTSCKRCAKSQQQVNVRAFLTIMSDMLTSSRLIVSTPSSDARTILSEYPFEDVFSTIISNCTGSNTDRDSNGMSLWLESVTPSLVHRYDCSMRAIIRPKTQMLTSDVQVALVSWPERRSIL